AAVAEIRRLQAKMATIDQERTNRATGHEQEEEIIESQKVSKLPIFPLSMEKPNRWST
ncbi:hypothetical protein A2U01_0085376, partial [Trifolium medium]|nr:hypothetical protein [Trifolium medium]